MEHTYKLCTLRLQKKKLKTYIHTYDVGTTKLWTTLLRYTTTIVFSNVGCRCLLFFLSAFGFLLHFCVCVGRESKNTLYEDVYEEEKPLTLHLPIIINRVLERKRGAYALFSVKIKHSNVFIGSLASAFIFFDINNCFLFTNVSHLLSRQDYYALNIGNIYA